MNLRRTLGILALAAINAATAAAQATIQGQVTVARSRPAPVENKRYSMTAKGGSPAAAHPLAVVYLEGSFPAPASQPVAEMMQQDLAFIPDVLPVQVGTKVEFPNRDDVEHSVYSTSSAKSFDLGRIAPAERPVPSQVFDSQGVVTIRCDIHEHMRAIILVLDTPHFVLSDPAGAYRLDGLPAGRRVLKVWLDSKTTLERTVELGAGSTLRADFP